MVLAMCSGLNLRSTIFILLNNILLPATLPLPASLPSYPTRIYPCPRPRAKLGEFERFMRMCVCSGVWALRRCVILSKNNKVIYVGVRIVCEMVKVFNPFSLKNQAFSVKNVQKLPQNSKKLHKSIMQCAFFFSLYYVDENKPFVSTTSA